MLCCVPVLVYQGKPFSAFSFIKMSMVTNMFVEVCCFFRSSWVVLKHNSIASSFRVLAELKGQCATLDVQTDSGQYQSLDLTDP